MCIVVAVKYNKIKGCTSKAHQIMLLYFNTEPCSGSQFLTMTQDQLAAALYNHCHDKLGGCDMPSCMEAGCALRTAVDWWQQQHNGAAPA